MKSAPSKSVLVFSILGLTIVIYANCLGSSFHYDDSHSILENPHIRSLNNLPRFFTDPKTFSGEAAMAMYRPFLVTTFAVNYASGRYEPWGYHAVNVGLHALGATLLALLLSRWFRDRWLGLWGGLLFVSHPIQTQAINYVSSRSVTLSAAGVLLALVMVSHGFRRSLPVTAYATALLSKSTAVVLIPLLVILRKAHAMQMRYFLPFALILAIVYFIILRPMKQRQKKVQEFRDALKVGDKVITTSGIYGSITKMNERSVELQVAVHVRIQVSRASVGGLQGQDQVVQDSGSLS